MPSYDLSCTGCGHAFEVFRQGFLREEDRTCPECGAAGAKQMFTGFITARPSRGDGAAFAGGGGGGGCCGGGCGCGGH